MGGGKKPKRGDPKATKWGLRGSVYKRETNATQRPRRKGKRQGPNWVQVWSKKQFKVQPVWGGVVYVFKKGGATGNLTGQF